MKNNKAAGIDNIPAELLKADITATANALHGLLQDIWRSNTMPSEWENGLIIKLQKRETKRRAITGEILHFYPP
jgi:hypothetical protein